MRTVEYLNGVLECVRTLVTGRDPGWDSSWAAQSVVEAAFDEKVFGSDGYREVAADLGIEGDLSTAVQEYLAGDVVERLARAGVAEVWPSVDPES